VYRIIVKGNASQKIILTDTIEQSLLNQNVLTYLQSKSLPIASSCNGEGICKKCIINNNLLACTLLLKNLIDHTNSILIEIAYL
jgi:Na+-transporting NADH:ubiquinone oxidoreductase subunit NqrF